MSRAIPNELEERRVIRLLGGAAEAIPPLHEVEVDTLLRIAVSPMHADRPRRRIALRRPQLLTAAAVAAAAVLVALPLRGQEPDRRSTVPSGGFEARTIAFPEGSALALLLSQPGKRRA